MPKINGFLISQPKRIMNTFNVMISIRVLFDCCKETDGSAQPVLCCFKTNPYLERAMMTGITRVSKESVFSDLNNLKVITITSKKYEAFFVLQNKKYLQH